MHKQVKKKHLHKNKFFKCIDKCICINNNLKIYKRVRNKHLYKNKF